jgi:predicted DNA-binding protein
MVRTQVYLTERERDSLAAIADATGKRQSELIREAVDCLIENSSKNLRETVLTSAAGMWRKRTDLPDFGTLRAEWDRR